MATFLWIGKQFSYPTSSVPTPAARLDKYCWNGSGNWKVLSSGSSGSFWNDTSATPGADDIVSVGDGMSASQYPGWIAARCPLLFGGYSGGVGAGTWSHTSTGATGTTYTSSLFSMYIDLSKGWSFSVPVGAGITGNILSWCIFNDSNGAPANPTTAADYITSVSSGFRNPENPLKLKVTSSIDFYDTKIKTVGQPNPDSPIALNVNRGLVFDAVKSYNQFNLPGRGFYYEVPTGLRFDSYSGDLTVNGGSFKNVWINSHRLPVPLVDKPPYGGSTFYMSLNGYITLNGTVVRDLEITNCSLTSVVGGTAARVTVNQSPADVTKSYYGGYTLSDPSSPNLFRYWKPGVETTLRCGFSGGYVWADQYIGITSTVPSTHVGVLNLSSRPIAMASGTGSDAILYDDRHNDYDANRSMCGYLHPMVNSYFDSTLGISYSAHMPLKAYANGGHVVLVGGITNSAENLVSDGFIPEINIESVYEPVSADNKAVFKWMPWVLAPFYRFNSFIDTSSYRTIVGTIRNNGGYVQIPDYPSLTFKIGQLYLSNYGRLDFSDYKSFNNLYGLNTRLNALGIPYTLIGGFTGLSGDRLIGGIVMNDNTGIILGGKNISLWNASILPDKTNSRTAGISGSASWSTFIPTTNSI
jgi:hypothetical protein